MPRALFRFTILTAIFGLFAPVAAGLLDSNYQPLRQYISELGAVGAPHADWVNLGIFLPTGLLSLVAVGWLATKLPARQRLPVLLLLGLTIGNLGAVLFPCDAGCPAIGSPRQAIHNSVGLLQYLSGGAALIWMSRRSKIPLGLFLGLAVLACVYLMGGPGQGFRGLWQRVAEVCLYGWLPYSVWMASSPIPDRSLTAKAG